MADLRLLTLALATMTSLLTGAWCAGSRKVEVPRLAGQILDKRTSEPVEGMAVYQGYGTFNRMVGTHQGNGSRDLRWTMTDAEGRFEFPAHVVAEALKKKQLAPGKEIKMKVAWHDPCRLGRRLGIYKQPRRILKAIPGLEVVEFERSGHNSLCCGNGGMAGYAFPEFGEWTARERIFEAEFIGADAIVTSCPWCEEMLRKGAAAKGSSVKVENVFSLLEQSL